MTARSMSKLIAEAMLSKKAGDILLMDLRKVTSTTDYFVLCSADSDTQVKAIAATLGRRVAPAVKPVSVGWQ